MEGQIRPHMRAYAQERTSAFNRHAAQHDFTGAERLLGLLRSLQAHFPDENLVDLESLEATLQTTRAQYTAQQEAEEATQRAKEATQRAEEERDRERRAREEMGQRVNNLERALEAERERKNLEIWGAVITGAANVIGKAIERKD